MMKHWHTTLSTVVLYVLFCSTVLGRPIRRNQDTRYTCFYSDSLQDIECLSEIVSTATGESGEKIVDYLLQNPVYIQRFTPCRPARLDISQSYGYLEVATQLLQSIADAHDPVIQETGELLSWLNWTLPFLNNTVKSYCGCEECSLETEVSVQLSDDAEFNEYCILNIIMVSVNVMKGEMTDKSCNTQQDLKCTRASPTIVQTVEEFEQQLEQQVQTITPVPQACLYDLLVSCSPRLEGQNSSTLYQGLCTSLDIIHTTSASPEVTDLFTQLNTTILPLLQDHFKLNVECNSYGELASNLDFDNCSPEDNPRMLCALFMANNNLMNLLGMDDESFGFTEYRMVECSQDV